MCTAQLVVGDPFGATTHTDLVTRCKAKGVKVDAVHNASIMNAVGCCGLQLYNFGRTVSIVFFTEVRFAPRLSVSPSLPHFPLHTPSPFPEP